MTDALQFLLASRRAGDPRQGQLRWEPATVVLAFVSAWW